jgi:hypothetical protein
MFTESHRDHEKTTSWSSTLTALIGPVLLVLVVLGLAVKWWAVPRISAPPAREWEPAVAQAELSKEKGDLYRAWSYYAEGAQLASAADDWQGLLAVACGLQKLGDSLEPSMNSHTMLIRAMMAAHRKHSSEGLEAVATAFRVTGEWFASLALSRIQESWPSKSWMARELEGESCWTAAKSNERSR